LAISMFDEWRIVLLSRFICINGLEQYITFYVYLGRVYITSHVDVRGPKKHQMLENLKKCEFPSNPWCTWGMWLTEEN
jgi:hypothetical protein